MSNEILSEIRLELDKYRADLKQGIEDATKAGAAGGKGFGDGVELGMSKAMGSLKTQFIALAGALAGAFTLKEAIKQSAQQEVAINGLNSALALTGNYTQEASQSFQKFAASLQKTTTVADDVILSGGSLLVTMGQLSGDGLERATQASLDFAAALAGQGMTPETAFNLVGKAASGNAAALKKYGIDVKDTGDNVRDFNQVLLEMEKRFRGMAQLQTNTFSGAMAQTSNAFSDVLKSMGNLITSSPTVIALVKQVGEWFAIAAEKIAELGKGRDVFNEWGLKLIEFAQLINTYVILPLELAFNLIKTGTLAITTGIATIGEALGLVSGDTLQSLQQRTADAANSVFDFEATAAAEGFLGKAEEFFTNVAPPVEAGFAQINQGARKALGDPTFLQVFAASFEESVARMAAKAKDLGAQIHATLATGVTNAFAAMGTAMAKGEDGMKAFGKAMISVLGDIAIQFGSTFMAMGVAKTLLFDPTGPLLIAAGAALAVLGGVLKGIGGGGGGAPATPSTGGGVVAAGGSGSPTIVDNGQNAVTEQQRGQVGTKVDVIVQGNVLDRRETGLQLVEVMNEAFGSNGVTLAQNNT